MKCDAKRLAEIGAREAAAFRGPWTHDTCTVECSPDDPRCPDPTPDDCQGEREALRIEAPEEYPDGQVICDVYGLETFTGPNAAFIAEARTDVPDLMADLDEARALLADALQAIAGLRDSGAGSVAAVSVMDRAAALGYLPSETVIPNLVAELHERLRTAIQTQENLEIRLTETERDRLLAVEKAGRTEVELAETRKRYETPLYPRVADDALVFALRHSGTVEAMRLLPLALQALASRRRMAQLLADQAMKAQT